MISNLNFPASRAGLKYEAGTYVGTGTYGESNPSTLTFGFQPKIVFIAYINTGGGAFALATLFESFGGAIKSNGTHCMTNVIVNDKSITWYQMSSAFSQFNEKNYLYNYVAIG